MTLDEHCSFLVGTGYYLPSTRVGNDFFEGKTLTKFKPDGSFDKHVTCSNAWILQNMGIRERRKAMEHETTHYMGHQAAHMALVDAGLSLDHLDGLVVGTVTSQRGFPSTASEIQHLFGSSPGKREFRTFDVAAACAGYLQSLDIADAHLRAKKCDALVAVGVEKLTSGIDLEDANAPLFGDGAGAGVLVSGSYLLDKKDLFPSGKLVGSVVATYIQGDSLGDNLMAIHRDDHRILRMFEGNKVLRYATRSMAEAVHQIKVKTGWSNDDIDLVIPHQANIRILEAVARVSHLPMEKIYVNIERYGNMSSATCGIAHAEVLREGRIEAGSNVILTAFGSGYVTGAVGLEYFIL